MSTALRVTLRKPARSLKRVACPTGRVKVGGHGRLVYELICLVCGRKFWSARPHRLTCSGACRVAMHRLKRSRAK